VPHPCAFFAQEPALSGAEEVGFHERVELALVLELELDLDFDLDFDFDLDLDFDLYLDFGWCSGSPLR
jgi:hypothetical protein